MISTKQFFSARIKEMNVLILYEGVQNSNMFLAAAPIAIRTDASDLNTILNKDHKAN